MDSLGALEKNFRGRGGGGGDWAGQPQRLEPSGEFQGKNGKVSLGGGGRVCDPLTVMTKDVTRMNFFFLKF